MKPIFTLAAAFFALSAIPAQAVSITKGHLAALGVYQVAGTTQTAFDTYNLHHGRYGGSGCQNTGTCTNQLTVGFVPVVSGSGSYEGNAFLVGTVDYTGAGAVSGNVVRFTSLSGCSSSTMTCSTATATCDDCTLDQEVAQ